MSNTSYPIPTTLWNDGSGPFGLRLTLSLSNAAIISALWGIVLSVTVTRLMALSITIVYLTFLHRRNTSLISDQGNVIAANDSSPGSLLYKLIKYVCSYCSHLSAAKTPFLTYGFLAALVLGIQGLVVWKVGDVFSNEPIPVLLAPCGYPAFPNISLNDDPTQLVRLGTAYIQANQQASQDSVTRFLQCSEN